MTNDNNSNSTTHPRAGLSIMASTASEAIECIAQAEAGGVRQIWMTMGGTSPDTLTLYAAAAMRTQFIRLGSSIVPTYPRNPLLMAQQALAISDIAPGRLQLGVGTSHRATIEGTYGIPMWAPLSHLREYIQILRSLLRGESVRHKGRFFTINATLPRPTEVPVLISALRPASFRLAGEIADGAISWVCPTQYLLETALPALRESAQAAGRPAPPLVAHVPVAITDDRQAALAAGEPMVQMYAGSPFYARMFASAGFPIVNGRVSEALVDSLVVSGDESAVESRLQQLLNSGLDELLLTHLPVSDEAAERDRLIDLIARVG